MIYIVLRTGKVLQYNEAEQCVAGDGVLSLHTKDGKFLIARLPLDVVERAEWTPPCQIMREPKDIRKKRRYR